MALFKNKKDTICPLIWSTILTVLTFILFKFATKINLVEAMKSISQLNTTFGITFSAFSVTALSLLPLLQTRKWFILFCESQAYRNLIENYKSSILLNLLLIFFGIIGIFSADVFVKLFNIIYILLSIFYLTFNSVFIYKNIKSLIDLLTSKSE